jgi:cobalt-precorrin 5A hydrolase/precorrin-3B C17-methyltransferase
MTAIVVLGRGALPLARRLRALLTGATIHGRNMPPPQTDVAFAHAGQHLPRLFAAGKPIVGICATGILIRTLAPAIGDKDRGPPVVAVAADGSVVVPLLGGHRGANALARQIAAAIGGVAAITTAGDVQLGLALDEPPPGWRIANPERVKPIAAALLVGKPVSLKVDAGEARWLTQSAVRFTAAGEPGIRVTDQAVAADERKLVFHPPVLALGVGCERDCAAAELIALAEGTLAEAGLAAGAVAAIVSLELKMDEPAVHALADRLGVPARFFTAAELRAETTRLANPSETVFRETGCYGVAEGAALAAVGPGGRLVVPKHKSARATCAVARAPLPLDGRAVGRRRGSLAVIGIGPGQASWRTGEADAALARASEIVGYRLYLDLLGPEFAGKALHSTELGAEEARVRRALDLAAEGRDVALVSSGDAGIYGLATLVFELIDRERRAAWDRLDIAVVPGVSALQAAAARAGAPLGHDFAAISLSDLLTPWSVIERRLRAVAEADFVVALYNPRSARRTAALKAARGILLAARSPETPVLLARNLGREGETISLSTLGGFDADGVDMVTLVIVGSSATRVIDGRQRRLYTPRGYNAKPGSSETS